MSAAPIYKDRAEAGASIAALVLRRVGREDSAIVLALPRGGVPVAAGVAAALDAPLDVFLVRKLGVPDQEELAMGAIASGGHRILNRALIRELRLGPEVVEEVSSRERLELERRESVYRGNRPPAPIAGRTVVLVDDGMATGASMVVAAQALRVREPSRIIIALPVAPSGAHGQLAPYADDVILPFTPEPFHSVGSWYRDFSQIEDAEVRRLLGQDPSP